MSQLIVRNIDGRLVRALKQRAARHGRSAEAEHREILREVLEADTERVSFKDALLAMPALGEDAHVDIPRDMPSDVEL